MMKKFDLEAAKAGQPVCDMEDNPVRIVCFDAQIPNYPILGLRRVEGVDRIETYTLEGVALYAGYGFGRDLCMALVHHEAWINVYSDSNRCIRHESEEAAKRNASYSCVATIKIEWNE